MSYSLQQKRNIILQVIRCQRIRILAYHNVIESSVDPFCVSHQAFSEQMLLLAKLRLPVISLEQAMQRLQRPANLQPALVITIDDAYADLLHHAIPVLLNYHFPATIFAVTGKTGQPSDWGETSPSYSTLTWTDLSKLSTLGFSIGSHTHTHPHLPALEYAELQYELENSRELVSTHIGQTFISLAYPYGEFDVREITLAQQAGYPCAVSAGGLWGNGKETDVFALRRELIMSTTNLRAFMRTINGVNDLTRFIRYRLHLSKLSR